MYDFNNKTEQPVNHSSPMYPPVYAPDVLSNQQIEEIHRIASQILTGAAQIGGGTNGGVDPTQRRSDVAWIEPNPNTKPLFEHLQKHIMMVNNEHYKFELSGIEALQYTTYDSKYFGEYKMHTDTVNIGENLVRKLSLSILLSDPSEFEGGHLIAMPYGSSMVMDGVKGRANFFPSWVPHCVTPVTKGVRKSLVIWAHGPLFK
jgi:PKHD-type hydroxylase